MMHSPIVYPPGSAPAVYKYALWFARALRRSLSRETETETQERRPLLASISKPFGPRVV